MKEVCILGAGIAGIAAADYAQKASFRVKLFDKNPYLGGHTYSHNYKGFIFDEGPHVSFTKNKEVRNIFVQSVQNNFYEFNSNISNIWNKYWITHPAQVNLCGLPENVIVNCLIDFINANKIPNNDFNNYADWCYQEFGKSFSEEFIFKYTEKYWATHPRDLTLDWIGKRIYRPNIEQIVRGAITKNKRNYHYITKFRYPKQGGFISYLNYFNVKEIFNANYGVNIIDTKRKLIEFTNGKTEFYDNLISSLPLPILVNKIKDTPPNIIKSASKLNYSSVVIVNLGIDKKEGLPDLHWFYNYNEDSVFARVNFPHNFSPQNCPEGCGSIQAEIYYSKYKKLPKVDLIEKTIKDLKKINVLSENHKILEMKLLNIPYANVIFDHERNKNLQIVNNYLDSIDINRCGRYGEWKYYWTDDSLLSGIEAVKKILK